MSDRTYVYVDGESHYLRAQDAWRKLHCSSALCLEKARYVKDGRECLISEPAKLFWTPAFFAGAQRTYYFTALVGDTAAQYQMSRKMRDLGLEPHLFEEKRTLQKNREHLRETEMLIEKPKQVDCALLVRLMLDAFSNLFDECHVFSSDVDYLPAFRAVREAFGKRVFVHGFGNGVAKDSPLRTQVDCFYDMTSLLQSDFELLQ